MSLRNVLSTLLLAASTVAAPLDDATPLQERQLPILGSLTASLQSIQDAYTSNPSNPYPALLSALSAIQPAPAPTSIEEAISRASAINAQATPTGYFSQSAALISAGLASNDVANYINGLTVENNATNNNPALPKKKTIYPKKTAADAPYSLTAKQLREQIYIPPGFTYGKKAPVLLVPGTGARGGNTYSGNFLKLLALPPLAALADPVILNYPAYGLDDAQVNGETVAYALNYVAGITGRNVSALAWSQGNLNVQWAVKYWPSARRVLTNYVGFSADYHGTTTAENMGTAGSAPSVLQQAYDSKFIKAIRSHGGGSAYVPTTSVYSGRYDEVVEPQQGTGASAFLRDVRGVGVTNIDIPSVCPEGSPAGLFADHESVLFNSLTYALVKDALTHGGPAKVKRIDLASACAGFAAPGLSLVDVLNTFSTIPAAGYEIAVYQPKVKTEPPIMGYAQ